MNLKFLEQKLKTLRDRIRSEGRLTRQDERELKALLEHALTAADENTTETESPFGRILAKQSALNDNHLLNSKPATLTPDQKARLMIVEKVGTGSMSIH